MVRHALGWGPSLVCLLVLILATVGADDNASFSVGLSASRRVLQSQDNKNQAASESSSTGSWSFVLLPVLVALETVLSADNAIALAAISRGLEKAIDQKRALDIGIAVAFVLRILLIYSATWVIHFWQIELLGAGYLLWLAFDYFYKNAGHLGDEDGMESRRQKFSTVWQAIPRIAVTDLAFSIDSVTTAVAISKDTWIVLLGGALGVLALRFMADLFIRWTKEYVYLETAGYVAVALVGARSCGKILLPSRVVPQWLLIMLIAAVFAWGFSKRQVALPLGMGTSTPKGIMNSRPFTPSKQRFDGHRPDNVPIQRPSVSIPPVPTLAPPPTTFQGSGAPPAYWSVVNGTGRLGMLTPSRAVPNSNRNSSGW